MGGDDFRKDDDFRKGDDFRKSSGSSIEEFERLMSGSKHTDSSVVRDIADRFFSELGKRVDDISNRNPFSLTLDARIDGGEKANDHTFPVSDVRAKITLD